MTTPANTAPDRVTLTAEDLDAIEAASREQHPYSGIIECWQRILGGPIPDKFDPTWYALSEAQWKEALRRLTPPKWAHAAAEIGMEWVNIGPSSYKEDSGE